MSTQTSPATVAEGCTVRHHAHGTGLVLRMSHTDRDLPPDLARVVFDGYQMWLNVNTLEVVEGPADFTPLPVGLIVDGLQGKSNLARHELSDWCEEIFVHAAKNVLDPTDAEFYSRNATSAASYSGNHAYGALADLAAACHHAKRLVAALNFARGSLSRWFDERNAES